MVSHKSLQNYRSSRIAYCGCSSGPPQIFSPSPLASALGVVFDEVTLRRAALRSVANSWMRWSLKWTLRFSSTWQRLCLAPLLPQPDTLPLPPTHSPPDPIMCPSTTPPAAPQRPTRAEITWPTSFPRYHCKKPTSNGEDGLWSSTLVWKKDGGLGGPDSQSKQLF